MQKSLWLFVLLVCSVTLHAQVQSKAFRALLHNLLAHTVAEISVEQALEGVAQITFVDARERREYEVSHLHDALWVGYDSLDLSALASVAKSQKIVVYCSIGYRSEKVAEKILALGYKDVSNMVGGIFEWKNRDFPLENENGPTDNVHAYSRTWGIWLKKGKKVYK